LLLTILETIDRSSAAFFDASAGNPNVALEYGYARAKLNEGVIYLFRDENASSSSGPGSPIISDLAGSVASQYALNDSRLDEAIWEVARTHPYARRFERFCSKKKYKGGTRRFLIRFFRQLDGKVSMPRRELVDTIVQETKAPEGRIIKLLNELRDGGLLSISRGNDSSSRVRIAK